MKKSGIIAFILFVIISAVVIIYGRDIYNFCSNKFALNDYENDFIYGSRKGEHGEITIKLRTDNSGAIKEVFVIEHPDNEIASTALQKLIKNSLDKQSSTEIDAVSGATETTDVYKKIVDTLLNQDNSIEANDSNEKVSLKDTEVAANIERIPYNLEGFKTGIGGYVMNQFQDADYSKNGNLVTHEYICAVMLNQYNRIEDVRFDHIASNISFNKFGVVPTGGARAYVFLSDKSKSGFNGLINDGDYVDIFDFEDKVLTYRHFEEIKNRYIAKRGYAPLVNALENAIDNARFVGASSGDTLGLSAYKVLKKKDIKDATDEENGHVYFKSDYAAITVDKNRNISSAMFDNVDNKATLTNVGKILGSRSKEIYTLNELSNVEKYSKIELLKYSLKMQLNVFADFIRGNTIDNVLSLISKLTDSKGLAKTGMALEGLKDIDFIEFIELISDAYIDATKIKG